MMSYYVQVNKKKDDANVAMGCVDCTVQLVLSHHPLASLFCFVGLLAYRDASNGLSIFCFLLSSCFLSHIYFMPHATNTPATKLLAPNTNGGMGRA